MDWECKRRYWESHIIRSTNAGQSWTKVKTFTNIWCRIDLAYAPSNSQIIYASRDNQSSIPNSGEIYKSSDGGTSWTLINTPGHLGSQGWYDNAIWVSPTDPNFVVIGGLDLMRFLIDKDNNSKVYVALGGYNSDNLYMTTNNGATWTDVSGNIPSAPIRSVVRHSTNANWLYAGTEVGIYASEDGGTTWGAINDGPANVPVDELFWYSNTQLTAASRTGNMTIAGQTFTITQTDTIFSDVSSAYWAYNYILAIYNAGITAGCSQNPLTYCPESNVTRAQMAVFLIRAF